MKNGDRTVDIDLTLLFYRAIHLARASAVSSILETAEDPAFMLCQ